MRGGETKEVISGRQTLGRWLMSQIVSNVLEILPGLYKGNRGAKVRGCLQVDSTG